MDKGFESVDKKSVPERKARLRRGREEGLRAINVLRNATVGVCARTQTHTRHTNDKDRLRHSEPVRFPIYFALRPDWPYIFYSMT